MGRSDCGVGSGSGLWIVGGGWVGVTVEWGVHCHKSLASLPSITGNDAGTKSWNTTLPSFHYQVLLVELPHL